MLRQLVLICNKYPYFIFYVFKERTALVGLNSVDYILNGDYLPFSLGSVCVLRPGVEAGDFAGYYM